MNLLGAVLYDPTTAVSKSAASLLAMTALDTTNLRVAVTIPAHGKIYVRIMGGALVGATTVPTILLGVMNGATVLARITPQDFPGTMNAATQTCPLYAECVITGLTPGAMNLDLAYAVQVVVASTNLKYGGPNNASGANAWGGISFQVWDPQPLQTTGQLVIDANGRVDVSKVAGTLQTARDLGAQLDAAVSSRMATFTLPANFASLVIDANGRIDLSKVLGAAINALIAGRIDANAGVVSDKTGYALTATYDPPSEGTLTFAQIIRLLLAAAAGKADGLGGTTVHFRDQADTKNRITATVDANGDRTAVTVDGT